MAYTESQPAGGRGSARGWLLLLLFCIGLTVVHTWPLAAAPQRNSRIDNADYELNAWAISWVAHQIVSDPVHLFDANIFWPSTRTLAYSEAMIVQGVLAAPVRWLGGSPVLAYSVAMFLGYMFTAFAFGAVVRTWTGSWSAALIAASAAGFNEHLVTRMAHLQAMHVEFIALALFAMDRIFTRQRARDAALLGVAFALQGLTSVYIMTFTTWAMIFAAAAWFLKAARAKLPRAVVLLAGAGVIALALLSFYLVAYYQLHLDQDFARTAEENSELAGSWTDYLSSVSWAHFWWSERFVSVSKSINFPGITVLGLVIVALASRTTRRDPRVVMCASVAAGCAFVSFVPNFPGYACIHPYVPLFWAVRVQAHIGQIVLLALAVLAAYGVLALQQRNGATSRWGWIVAALLLCMNVEVLRAPLPYREFRGIPAIYDYFRDQPTAIIAEFPMGPMRGNFTAAEYMINSTRHWRPMVNGYSGFRPPIYDQIWSELQTFPAPDALEAIHRRGITHVIVHMDRIGGESVHAITSAATLREVAHEGNVYIYRVR